MVGTAWSARHECFVTAQTVPSSRRGALTFIVTSAARGSAQNAWHTGKTTPVLTEGLIYFLTRLWTLTKFSEPGALLNSVGRFFPWGSKQTFSVSPSIS